MNTALRTVKPKRYINHVAELIRNNDLVSVGYFLDDSVQIDLDDLQTRYSYKYELLFNVACEISDPELLMFHLVAGDEDLQLAFCSAIKYRNIPVLLLLKEQSKECIQRIGKFLDVPFLKWLLEHFRLSPKCLEGSPPEVLQYLLDNGFISYQTDINFFQAKSITWAILHEYNISLDTAREVLRKGTYENIISLLDVISVNEQLFHITYRKDLTICRQLVEEGIILLNETIIQGILLRHTLSDVQWLVARKDIEPWYLDTAIGNKREPINIINFLLKGKDYSFSGSCYSTVIKNGLPQMLDWLMNRKIRMTVKDYTHLIIKYQKVRDNFNKSARHKCRMDKWLERNKHYLMDLVNFI